MESQSTSQSTIAIVDVFDVDASIVSRKIGGQSLLPWLVRRVTDAERLNRVVAIARQDAADGICGYLPPDVEVFATAIPQVLNRFVAAAEKFQATAIVHVPVDSPFVDPELIDSLIREAEQRPADHVAFAKDHSADEIGLFTDWYSVDALRRAAADSQVNQPVVWSARIEAKSDSFPSRYLNVPTGLQQSNLRLRLDGPESWDQAEQIIAALGDDEISWQRISRWKGR